MLALAHSMMTAQGIPAAAVAADARRCPAYGSHSTDGARLLSLYSGVWRRHVCHARYGVPANVGWEGPCDSLHRSWLQRVTSKDLLRIPYMHAIIAAMVLDAQLGL